MECFSIQRLFLALIIVHYFDKDDKSRYCLFSIYLQSFFFLKLITPDVSLHPFGERKDNSLQ